MAGRKKVDIEDIKPVLQHPKDRKNPQLVFYPMNKKPIKRLSYDIKKAEALRLELENIQSLYKYHTDLRDSVYDNVDKIAYILWFNHDKFVPNTSKIKTTESLADFKALDKINANLRLKIESLEVELLEANTVIVEYREYEYIKRAEMLKALPDDYYIFESYSRELRKNRALKKSNCKLDKNGMNGADRRRIAVLKQCLEHCPDKKLTTLNWEDLTKFLEYHTFEKVKNRCNVSATWNTAREHFTFFYSWACKKWEIINPTDKTEFINEKDYSKDIVWLELNEIKHLIDNIDVGDETKNKYWKAMIAVMAFAGLSAHEMRALHTINISNSLDIRPCKEAFVSLKNSKRERKVWINQLLRPYLDDYMVTEIPGKHLFPDIRFLHKDKRPWSGGELTKTLRGNAWAEQKGILPDDDNIYKKRITCLTLRRTFGSIMLKYGNKTFAQVAALMGNSVIMVERHYARLKSVDIETDIDTEVIQLIKFPA